MFCNEEEWIMGSKFWYLNWCDMFCGCGFVLLFLFFDVMGRVNVVLDGWIVMFFKWMLISYFVYGVYMFDGFIGVLSFNVENEFYYLWSWWFCCELGLLMFN